MISSVTFLMAFVDFIGVLFMEHGKIRVVFNSEELSQPKTDAGFHAKAYKPEHQKSESPLAKIHIKCISSFPLD